MKFFVFLIGLVNICLIDCRAVSNDPETTANKVTRNNEAERRSSELLDQPKLQNSLTNGVKPLTPVLYSRGPCPYGFVYNANQRSCYSFITNTPGVTWFEALSFCMSMQASLVAIESDEEQIYILGMVHHFGQGQTSVWTGGNTLGKQGDWVWAGGAHAPQKRFGYTRWAPGEPSNMHNREKPEKCVDLWNEINHKWNDRRCEDKLPFICKRGV